LASRNAKYAVAIHHTRVCLFLIITRLRGEIFVNLPTDFEKRHVHASYHADGTSHLKSYGRRVLSTRIGPRPDENFRGVFALWRSSVTATDPFPFQDWSPAQFVDLFEIPIDNLSETTSVAVNLVAPGETPLVEAGTTVLMQRSLEDAIPWIVVSLYDSPEARVFRA
jgi:hypothetical protein